MTPSEVAQGGTNLEGLGTTYEEHTGKLQSNTQGWTAHARSDKSGVGQVFVKMGEKVGDAFSKMGKQLSRVTKGAGTRLKTTAKTTTENESKVKKSFGDIHNRKDDGTDRPKTVNPTQPSSSGGNTKPSSAPSHGQDKPKSETPEPTPHQGGETQPSSASSHGSDKPKSETPESEPKGKGRADENSDNSELLSSAKPPLRDRKDAPPTATDLSDKFKNKPQMDKPSNYSKPLPDVSSDYHQPPDKNRGAKITQLDDKKDNLTRDEKTGLITHVNGTPVKKWVGDLSEQQAKHSADPAKSWQDANSSSGKRPPKVHSVGKEGRCSAVAIDLKTGLVTQGVNGKGKNVIPEDKLHPLLQENLQNMRAYKHPVQASQDEPNHEAYTGGRTDDGQAHYSSPAGHAEVKAVNELLWQRQAAGEAAHGADYKLPQSTLQELRFDPRWTVKTGEAEPFTAAPACANCNSILHGVPSYTGRCQYDPNDYRYQNPSIAPHED